MATKRGYHEKTALEPHEKLMAAFFYLIRGISQHDIAAMLGVNPGRVNEAIMLVRRSLEFPGGAAPPAGDLLQQEEE